MCGNHRQSSITRIAAAGSPPRVREPPSDGWIGDLRLRITPACAGTTIVTDDITAFGQDHPRVCGNHSYDVTSKTGSPGSPPRVREPHTPEFHLSSTRRITPACAGTTGCRRSDQPEDEDHPRVCGNHRLWPGLCCYPRGSPPRVREPQLRNGH